MRTYHLIIYSSIILLVLCQLACTRVKETTETDFFPGQYPGKAEIKINNDDLVLHNDALSAIWMLKNNSIVLKELTNKYDNTVVSVEDITLFAIEMSDGRQLTNHDFKLKGELQIITLQATDSLPTKSLRFPGKEISGVFLEKNNRISITWTAQLREGSNYIRQNIEVKPINKPLKISKVIFFDGILEGASYAGSVLGSPITYENFFFGLEHPIAHSKALLSRIIGGLGSGAIDISDMISQAGDYVIAIEHGGGPQEFNVSRVQLSANGKILSADQHPLNGHDGSNLYHLRLENYSTENTYQIHVDVQNEEKASGRLHLYRKTDGLLNFFVKREDYLVPGKTVSEWSVIGVMPENQNRRAFLYYLERERARPYKQFLHYNCWWDITGIGAGAASFTSEQLIERMHAWNTKLIEPYDVKLHAFVFDDGWDDLDSVWYFDPVKFPDGFAPQAALCREYNSGIGVWMSPFGGYLENKRRRLESAKREGLETNYRGLSLAGPNYYSRFLERAIDMLDNYGINYFKFDGFGGSEPEYLPDMEAGARLIKNLRKHNPDVFVNITVGSWPSPFWLHYADCTWRGSGDAHLAGQGSRTQRFISYRDGTLHNNIVSRAPFYPLNSIMTVGITYANLGHSINCVNDSIEDFTDMVRSFFGAGSSLQELYISHDRMKEEFWPVLAEAAKWAQDNEDVLKDVHWIGGSPINLEVYGFASWKPEKGILTLRNPGDERVEYKILLDEMLEIPASYSGVFELKIPWEEDQHKPVLKVPSSQAIMLEFEPYELKIFEVLPMK